MPYLATPRFNTEYLNDYNVFAGVWYTVTDYEPGDDCFKVLLPENVGNIESFFCLTDDCGHCPEVSHDQGEGPDFPIGRDAENYPTERNRWVIVEVPKYKYIQA